jgi:2-methylfumaryl-CoA hydratase
MNKTSAGHFFEDFTLGQLLAHASARTVTTGDASLYTALYGNRFLLQSSAQAARKVGFRDAPMDDLMVFHVVFGKTVPDVSVNAVANLGYAGGRFGVPVFAGDTLRAHSEVIGLKQNSNGTTGTVYVRSKGLNQHDEVVLDYVRWVMVRKRDASAPAPNVEVPNLPAAVAATSLYCDPDWSCSQYMSADAGSPFTWDDYQVQERIDHVDGMTVEEADHMTATRLYQNTAKVHFNQHTEGQGRFGRRLVYGGHVISIVRAATFNGLGNAFRIAAINGGRHVAPIFAGDTVYAWSEVLERLSLTGRDDVGALRLRTVGVKNRACDDFPFKDANGNYVDDVVLDFDYTVLMPTRASI